MEEIYSKHQKSAVNRSALSAMTSWRLWVAGAVFVAEALAFAKPFTVNREFLKPELELPVKVVSKDIAPTKRQILKRVRGAEKDPRVEPLFIQVPVDDDARAAFVMSIGRPKKYRALMARLDRLVAEFSARGERDKNRSGSSGNAVNAGDQSDEARRSVHQQSVNQNESVNPLAAEELPATIKVKVRPELFNLISFQAIRDILKRSHLQVTVDGATLQRDPDLGKQLLFGLSPFFTADGMKRVQDKVRTGVPIVLDRDLLPGAASRKITAFEIFRGPNCFMTALAFQYPQMIRSELVNVRLENNHHEVMINNDELWRVLQSSFYEVDPARTKLKYGDMLVFFSTPVTPKKGQSTAVREISYRWIKHATTFLFNDFVYSKGSKSPNSPYLVGTLRGEWQAWEKHIEKNGGQLGVKVFRKPLKSATNRPPKSLEDWMY